MADSGGDVPVVALRSGERASWEGAPLTCPKCGAGPLPLRDSVPPGVHYVMCCGGTWLAGPMDLEGLFRKEPTE